MTDLIACLAVVVYLEARSEPIPAQYAVAHVVLERTRQHGERTPEAVCAVGWAANQFAPTKVRTFEYDARAYSIAKYVARDALAGIDKTPAACIGATHFHTKNERPQWARKMKPRCTLGAHVFY